MARARAQLRIGTALFALASDGGDEFRRDTIAAAAEAAAQYWFREILPKHFTPAAMRLYPDAYALRNKSYQIRKARKQHHQDPMVWKGDFKRSQLSSFSLQSRIGRSMVRITLRLPAARALNLWGAGRKHDFAAALQAVNQADSDKLREVMAQVVGERVARAAENGDEIVSTHVA